MMLLPPTLTVPPAMARWPVPPAPTVRAPVVSQRPPVATVALPVAAAAWPMVLSPLRTVPPSMVR
jgi:hypothetical protein